MPDYSKLAKGLTSFVKGAEDAAPAVNRLDMNFKDVTKRIPELTDAANMVARGEMTGSQYDSLVRKLKPVAPYDFVPQPATSDDAMRALTENKRPMFGKTSEMTAGEQADLRLDIPAYKDHGVWVNSIHRKDQPTMYGATSSVKNATMIGAPDKALKVAQGGPKAPFAVIRGEWNPMDEAKAVKNAQKYLNHPDWKQVGYDPERHGFFYDRASMAPVVGADEVIQIGPLVLAKKPKYGKPEDFPFKKGGGTHMKTKQGAIRMQVGGLNALANAGKAGAKVSKTQQATLFARGMEVPGVHFADTLNPNDIMRMSEALGASGSEGKTLNLTQADRSRVFGPNKGGTGFSGLQLTSPPHQQARSTWGVGKPSHLTRLTKASDDDTIWSTFIGSPTQHMSNPVTTQRMYEAHKKANPSAKLVEDMNKMLNKAVDEKTGKPMFPNGIDISDPSSLNQAQTFNQRKLLAKAMVMGGEKKGEKATQEAFRIIKEETDPLLMDSPTYAVGNRLFTIDKNSGLYRPDLNSAFPHITTGDDFGLLFEPAPLKLAAPQFVNQEKYLNRLDKNGNPSPISHKDLSSTTPKQFISEEYLTNLQKEGYKDGGSAEPPPFHDFDQIMKRKDGGTVNTFEQRLKSALNMAMGGEVSDNTTPDMTDSGRMNYGGQYAGGGGIRMGDGGSYPPKKDLPEMSPQKYLELLALQPKLGLQSEKQIKAKLEEQYKKEKEEGFGTPQARTDRAIKTATPFIGAGADVGNFFANIPHYATEGLSAVGNYAMSKRPSMSKPASVLDTEGTGDRVPKYPLQSLPEVEPFYGSAAMQRDAKEAGLMGDSESPVYDTAMAFLAPYGAAKAPRAVEGGLNAVTAAARRPFTPATLTTEAVSPDLAKFKNPAFQDYVTGQMIGEGSAVPMTTMGGRKTSQTRGQGVYLNEAKELEKNPMVGVNIPRAGNLATNKGLRADIATAGQELGQEAMAAHRFVPMATNQIKDASAMMIRGQGGRPLTSKEVMAMANELPDMIVTHSPANGGLMIAPYGMTKGQIPQEFLSAQSVARKVLGKDANIQFGKADPKKDLMYMMRNQYAEEGGRGTSQGAQATRNQLKRMDKNFPLARQ
jgi:hypothetical protein